MIRRTPIALLVLLPALAAMLSTAPERRAHAGDDARSLRLHDAPECRIDAGVRQAERDLHEGRFAEGELLLRALLDTDPDHEPALDLLDRLAAGRATPRCPAVLNATRRLLPARFTIHETTNFIVLSDADAEQVRRQGIRLERTRTQFRRFATRLGIRERPLRNKLIVIFFADREEYRAFAAEHDDVRDGWVAGYYAPATDRIAFYCIRKNPSVAEAHRRLNELREEMRRLERETNTRDHTRRLRAHLDAETERVNLFTETVSTATTVHEATHQLSFHTRIQVPWVQYPIWISEGMATAFETDDVDLPFGPDRDTPGRRARFEELLAEGDLLPLRELIGLVDAGPNATDTDVDRIYHQSYALFSWLYRARRPQLAEHLRALRREPAGAVKPERSRALFEEAFGPIDRLERTWQRAMSAQAR